MKKYNIYEYASGNLNHDDTTFIVVDFIETFPLSENCRRGVRIKGKFKSTGQTVNKRVCY